MGRGVEGERERAMIVVSTPMIYDNFALSLSAGQMRPVAAADPGQQEAAPRPWLLDDPAAPASEQSQRFKDAHPLVVDVHAGDVLYLPSLWYHHVAQRGDPCIAVNTWLVAAGHGLFACVSLCDSHALCPCLCRPLPLSPLPQV